MKLGTNQGDVSVSVEDRDPTLDVITFVKARVGARNPPLGGIGDFEIGTLFRGHPISENGIERTGIALSLHGSPYAQSAGVDAKAGYKYPSGKSFELTLSPLRVVDFSGAIRQTASTTVNTHWTVDGTGAMVRAGVSVQFAD